MAATEKFQRWANLEFMRRTGEMLAIEQAVERELTKVRTEIKIDGRWTEVRPDQLVDDPDNFVLEVGETK